jgi:phosphotransferase system HPr (HPr) family protein
MTAATGVCENAPSKRADKPSTGLGGPGCAIARVAIAPYTTAKKEAVKAVAERQLTITNKVGLHARPAALFVQTAARFKDTRVQVVKNGDARDAKSILSVLTLGVSQGTTITVRADGPQAEAAIAALSDLVDRDFGE